MTCYDVELLYIMCIIIILCVCVCMCRIYSSDYSQENYL